MASQKVTSRLEPLQSKGNKHTTNNHVSTSLSPVVDMVTTNLTLDKLNIEAVLAAPVPVNTTDYVPDIVFSVLEKEQPLVSDMAMPLENSFELLKELDNLAHGKVLIEDLQPVAASSTLTVCNEDLVIGSSGAHLTLANLPGKLLVVVSSTIDLDPDLSGMDITCLQSAMPQPITTKHTSLTANKLPVLEHINTKVHSTVELSSAA